MSGSVGRYWSHEECCWLDCVAAEVDDGEAAELELPTQREDASAQPVAG
ncbi:MAG: hypothetical protein WCD35_11060 [Mycobacteriales bacterium]